MNDPRRTDIRQLFGARYPFANAVIVVVALLIGITLILIGAGNGSVTQVALGVLFVIGALVVGGLLMWFRISTAEPQEQQVALEDVERQWELDEANRRFLDEDKLRKEKDGSA